MNFQVQRSRSQSDNVIERISIKNAIIQERISCQQSTSLNFEPPAFENAAIIANSETKVQCSNDRCMFSPSLVKVGPRKTKPKKSYYMRGNILLEVDQEKDLVLYCIIVFLYCTS